MEEAQPAGGQAPSATDVTGRRFRLAFAARLQDAVDPHTTRTGLLGAVHRALEPARVSLWLREAEW